jgi:hypothetical protein
MQIQRPSPKRVYHTPDRENHLAPPSLQFTQDFFDHPLDEVRANTAERFTVALRGTGRT